MAVEKNNEKNVGVILLAAGNSSRLGHPKQLLLHHGQTLLQHSLQVACASYAFPIVVVLGALADSLQKEIGRVAATVVENKAWQEGMASSIRCGVNALVETDPSVEGAVLMVCDQPYVTATLVNDLMAAHQNTGKPIVTCSYAGTFGPPTLFHKSLFGELLHLKGDTGARSILQQHAGETAVISFPEGTLDIDTEKDYERIQSTANP